MIKKILYLILAIFLIPRIAYADIGLDVGTNYTRIIISETGRTDLFPYLGINWIRTLTPNLRLPPVNGQEVNILAVYPYNCRDTTEDKEQTFIQAVINNPAVKAVEIGNEPNIEQYEAASRKTPLFDCPPEVFGDQVIRMHNALSPSGRKIIFGGLFIKDSLHADLYNMNPDTQNNYVTPYLTQTMTYFNSKGVKPWDAVGLHFYVNEDGSRDSGYILGKYQSYISAIRRVTGSLPIWVTEYGWRSDYAQMTPQKQAEFLTATSNWLKQKVEMAFWYSQIDSVQHDKWQRLGVYDAQAELIKPSFFALKSVQGSLTTCAEGADQVSCTVAGSAVQSCKWQTCAGKSACVDSSKAEDCTAIEAQEAQRRAQEEAERPLAEARRQAEQANQPPNLRLSGFQMSHCLYLSEQNCNLSSDCAVQDRRVQRRNQNICLPKIQSEDDNILQIGVRYYQADFSTLNEKYCSANDQDCKKRVLVNCLNNIIKDNSVNRNLCGQVYAVLRSKQQVIDSICAREPEGIPEYEPDDECRNNIQCIDDSVIAYANFEECVIQARRQAEEVRRAAPQPAARGAPAGAGLPAARPQVSYSDFCDNGDRECFDIFNLYCKSAQDTQQCMSEYGYYPATVAIGSCVDSRGNKCTQDLCQQLPGCPQGSDCRTVFSCSDTALAPGTPDYQDYTFKCFSRNVKDFVVLCKPPGAPAVGQPDAAQAVLTDQQCAQEYKSKRDGQDDYYCDNDSTCTLRTQVSDGQGRCKDEFKRGQDLSKCPNSCQVAEDEATSQLISQLNNLCSNLPISQDKRDCSRELEREVVISCLNVSEAENCINQEIEKWLQIRLVNKRANELRKTCQYTNACFSKASQACSPTTSDENEFNSCVDKFKEENPIKDRDWQVSMLGALCAQYFGPDNQNSDRCVSDSDNQCKGYIIENDFTTCVKDSAQKQGAVPGQKILYKVALNCPGEENYVEEKIIYQGNQPQDQTFIISDYVDQIACELKQYYANLGPDDRELEIQTVIFTNKELAEEEPADTQLPPIQPSCREEARDLGQGVGQNFEICPDKQPEPRGSQYCINGNPNIEDCSATPGEGCAYNEGEPFCEAGQEHTCHGLYNEQGICQYKEGVDPDCSPCR